MFSFHQLNELCAYLPPGGAGVTKPVPVTGGGAAAAAAQIHQGSLHYTSWRHLPSSLEALLRQHVICMWVDLILCSVN